MKHFWQMGEIQQFHRQIRGSLETVRLKYKKISVLSRMTLYKMLFQIQTRICRIACQLSYRCCKIQIIGELSNDFPLELAIPNVALKHISSIQKNDVCFILLDSFYCIHQPRHTTVTFWIWLCICKKDYEKLHHIVLKSISDIRKIIYFKKYLYLFCCILLDIYQSALFWNECHLYVEL